MSYSNLRGSRLVWYWRSYRDLSILSFVPALLNNGDGDPYDLGIVEDQTILFTAFAVMSSTIVQAQACLPTGHGQRQQGI
jgi:hypothetical protein